jgi:hypothetical protein
MNSSMEATIVVVLIVLVWIAIEGWLGAPLTGGTSPRLRSSRQPFRFSLRTLLILTTLVAVILGLGVWLARL